MISLATHPLLNFWGYILIIIYLLQFIIFLFLQLFRFGFLEGILRWFIYNVIIVGILFIGFIFLIGAMEVLIYK